MQVVRYSGTSMGPCRRSIICVHIEEEGLASWERRRGPEKCIPFPTPNFLNNDGSIRNASLFLKADCAAHAVVALSQYCPRPTNTREFLETTGSRHLFEQHGRDGCWNPVLTEMGPRDEGRPTGGWSLIYTLAMLSLKSAEEIAACDLIGARSRPTLIIVTSRLQQLK